MPLIRKAFKRLHYPIDIIAQCVRRYLAYALSLRNLEEMMAERGIIVDHSMVHCWVIRLVPLPDKAFAAINVLWVVAGEGTKPVSGSKASGNTCTGLQTLQDRPSIFC